MRRRVVTRTLASVTVLTVAIAALSVGVLAPAASAQPNRPAGPAPETAVGTAPSHLVTVTPFRLADTRDTSPIAAGGSRTFSAAGAGGLPSTGITALDLTITAPAPARTGTVTAWAAGTAKPSTTSLRFTAGRPASAHAVVQLSDAEQFSLANTAAYKLNVTVDVTGYYAAGASADAGTFVPLTPSRLVDTRNGTGVPQARVAAGSGVTTQVTGRGGVPSDVSAVAVTVSAVGPQTAGSLIAYPAGTARPAITTLTFGTGRDAANLAVLPVSIHGLLAIHNNAPGSIDVTVDVVGYYVAGSPATAGALNYVSGARVLDTRSGAGGNRKGAVPGGGRASFTVSGKAGVPAVATGRVTVVGVLTAVAPMHSGSALAYTTGTTPTSTTSLQFTSGTSSSDLVVLPVSSTGQVSIDNRAAGAIHFLFDVQGYYLRTDLGVPSASTSHNIRIPKAAGAVDTGAYTSLGEADATADRSVAGAHLRLLHIGAQTVKNLGTAGVVLSGSPSGDDSAYRYTDAQLVDALTAYLDGYRAVAPSSPATVVVDTNSDGTFVSTPSSIAFTATQKGDDWARHVVQPLRAHLKAAGASALTVVGGNDIEAGFAASLTQAKQWISAYLAGSAAPLVYTGSLDACPYTYRTTADCQAVDDDNTPPVRKTWTRADYVQLTHGLGPGRISVLPQVYSAEYPNIALQWTNVDITAGGTLQFLGSLTEHALGCTGGPCDMTPAGGWATLWNALSAIGHPPPAVATDLDAVTG